MWYYNCNYLLIITNNCIFNDSEIAFKKTQDISGSNVNVTWLLITLKLYV